MTTTFGPYPARCVAVHDGDTLDLDIDLGFDHQIASVDFDGKTRMSCRVHGINAAELATPAGHDAWLYALTLIRPGDRCTVVSHGYDKYGGRFLGTVTLADGRDFATEMLSSGHALPYDGTGPKPV